MTESENQKLDLIIRMIEQLEKRQDHHDNRFDKIEQTQKEDRAENVRQFDKIVQERKADRAEWKVSREEDRVENKRQFESIIQEMKEDRAENKRHFERLVDYIDDVKRDLIDAIGEEKNERKRLEAKVEKVYEARNQVTVSFSRSFAAANAFIAGVIAVIVSLFMGDRF